MSLAVRDGNGAGTSVKTSPDGSDHVPHNNVDTLPTAFTTDTSAIKVAVQAIAAIISGGRLAVDLSTTVVTYLSNIPTLATYLNTLQGAVSGGLLSIASTQLPTTIGTKAKASALATSIATDDPAFYETAVSGTLTSIGTVVAPMTGRRTAGVYVPTSSTLVATLVAEYTIIGAGGWEATNFVDPFTGASSATLVTASGVSAARILYVPPGAVSVRVRPSAFTSGTGTVYVTAGNSDASLVKLDPASTVYDGNKTVTTAGTRVALAASQALTKGVRVRAKDANSGLIYIGGASVSSSSDRLSPAEPTWMDVNNLANVYIDAAVSGDGVTYSAW